MPNQLWLYKSADLKFNITIFWSTGWIWTFKESFFGSFLRPIKLWCQMYKSADLKININVSFDPLDRIGHSKCHFGVAFQGQSYCDFKSAVSVQISWLKNQYHCIFWSTGRIWTFKDSFLGSFSSPRCQGAKGDRGQKVQRWQGSMVPRVPGFKRCQGYLGQKLRRSTLEQGFFKNSFHIKLVSWRRSILFFLSFSHNQLRLTINWGPH